MYISVKELDASVSGKGRIDRCPYWPPRPFLLALNRGPGGRTDNPAAPSEGAAERGRPRRLGDAEA